MDTTLDFDQENFDLYEALKQIQPADALAYQAACDHWNSLGKPLYSLGLLEKTVSRMAAVKGDWRVTANKPGLVIMCADNGVVAEGVSQVGQDVTASVTKNFTTGGTSVAVMAKRAGVTLYPVDIGVNAKLDCPGLYNCKVAMGTKNMVQQPAMTKAEAERAIGVGIQMVAKCVQQGCDILATGEMGIGNTTTSSAVLAVLLDQPVERMTGKGSGLTKAGMERKKAAITRAIQVNKPNPQDPLDVLAKVGGLDIAGLCGVFLGGAIYHVPVLIDGVISATAALLAKRLCPAAGDYMLASHCSYEPAGQLVLQALELRAPLQADMCLGEGTGAVAFLPVLQLALTVYYEMGTYAEANIDNYIELEEKD